MSDIPLPKPYAPEAFSEALDNLTKRYDSEGDQVHYKDAAFDGLSEDQAGDALRFLSEINLIEVPKQGQYIPPGHVVTWQRSIDGPAKQEAKKKAAEELESYDVYSEIKFLLDNSSEEKDLSTMAREVGGKLGIDEDDLPKMERSIEILAECGFLELDDDQVLAIPDDSIDEVDQSERDDNTHTSSEEENSPESAINPENQEYEFRQETEQPNHLITADLKITLDATEMDTDDLEKKLEIIEDSLQND